MNFQIIKIAFKSLKIEKEERWFISQLEKDGTKMEVRIFRISIKLTNNLMISLSETWILGRAHKLERSNCPLKRSITTRMKLELTNNSSTTQMKSEWTNNSNNYNKSIEKKWLLWRTGWIKVVKCHTILKKMNNYSKKEMLSLAEAALLTLIRCREVSSQAPLLDL